MQLLGAGLVLLSLLDIFLTVLYARSGVGLLSPKFHRLTWSAFRALSRVPVLKDRVLSYAGPTLLVATVVLWTGLLLLGFALVIWPALGSGIRAASGETPTDFAAALYYAGWSLTTLGTGDLVPTNAFYRLLSVFEAAVGFSVLTLSLTFFTSVYSALVRRNVFAMSLFHSAGGGADAAELVARLGSAGDLSGMKDEAARMARNLLDLYESHHSYPVLHFFRFRTPAYATARVLFVVMDAVSLMRSALDERAYASLVRSAAVSELWGGGMELLGELSRSFLKGRPLDAEERRLEEEGAWRAHYARAVARFQEEGIAVAADAEAGADAYVAMRGEWEPRTLALAEYLAYAWPEITGECGAS